MQSGTTHTFRLPCTCTSVERKVLHCHVFMYNAERYHTHLPAALHMQQFGKEGAVLLHVYVYTEQHHTHLPAALHVQQCRKEGAVLLRVYV